MIPYWEPQHNDQCRIHALNAFFGEHKITPELFSQYCSEYDADMTQRYNLSISCRDFDIVNSNQMNIVSWILKKHGIWSQYFAPNELHNKIIELPNHSINNFVFIYNDGHIWGMKKIGDKVWNIDSLNSGPQLSNFSQLQHVNNIGFIFPVEITKEFYIQIEKLKTIVPQDTDEGAVAPFKPPSIDSIRKYLIELNKKKQILGNIEIPLNKAIDILEYYKRPCDHIKFKPIHDLIEDYNYFLIKFTNGNYLNINLILEYLPNILYYLVAIRT